jgi:hypothetical protein
MKKERSFRERLKAGSTKEELMKYYALSEVQYQRVLKSLANIWQKVSQAGY